MKIIFKIVRYDEEAQSISVKFCYEKSRKPIDEYRSYAIDLKNLDTYDYFTFSDSLIRQYGLRIVEKQEDKLDTIAENIPTKIEDKFEVRDLIDKAVEGKYISRKRFPLKMRRIEL